MKKLKEQAAATKSRVTAERNATQKIKLILNVIAPDNYDKKFGELRSYLFGELKSREECMAEGIDFDEEEHKLQENEINRDVLEVIVRNTFKKAIKEREYCIFYGELCEKMMKLELKLMDLDAAIKNMKRSAYRQSLLVACKETFEQFFDEGVRERETTHPERAANFIESLFGNVEFVGELYRRKILPHTILVNIFESLLGMNDTNPHPDDLTVEAAIKLMNKVGQKFEEDRRGSLAN